MDENSRARISSSGNALIKPKVASNRGVATPPPARHVVRVHVGPETTSAGYRYNDDLDIGLTINTNTLIGFFTQ